VSREKGSLPRAWTERIGKAPSSEVLSIESASSSPLRRKDRFRQITRRTPSGSRTSSCFSWMRLGRYWVGNQLRKGTESSLVKVARNGSSSAWELIRSDGLSIEAICRCPAMSAHGEKSMSMRGLESDGTPGSLAL